MLAATASDLIGPGFGNSKKSSPPDAGITVLELPVGNDEHL